MLLMELRKITQFEFDNLETNSNIKMCPGFTDYSDIKSFGKFCSFG